MTYSNDKISVINHFPTWLPKTQTWMYNQVRYLPETIKSHIVCEITENLEQFALPNIHALSNESKLRFYWERGVRKLKLRRYLGLIIDIAKQEKASILHSHFGDVGWINLSAAKRANLKHIVTFYGYDVNYLPKNEPEWNKRYQQLFAAIDLILCEGSHMAQCIVDLGCPAEKVKVHHLGVSVDEIDFKPRIWKPNTPLRVLMASTFTEKKGLPYGIEALGKIQHQVPLEITIIGDAVNHPETQREKQKILAIVEQYNLQSKIRFLGYQPHKVLFEEAYQNHIFLSPSVTASDGETEGGAPVCLIEMAATGMPIVSTTHCDIKEVIINGVTGLLAKERDVDGLIEHLQKLINHPEQWQSMVEKGRERIESEYNAIIQGYRLANIYLEQARKTNKKK